jgi:hypothetical protein
MLGGEDHHGGGALGREAEIPFPEERVAGISSRLARTSKRGPTGSARTSSRRRSTMNRFAIALASATALAAALIAAAPVGAHADPTKSEWKIVQQECKDADSFDECSDVALRTLKAAHVPQPGSSDASDTYIPYTVSASNEWFLPGWVWTENDEPREQCLTEGPQFDGMSVLCVPSHIARTHHLLDLPPEMQHAPAAPLVSGKFAPPDVPWLMAHGAFLAAKTNWRERFGEKETSTDMRSVFVQIGRQLQTNLDCHNGGAIHLDDYPLDVDVAEFRAAQPALAHKWAMEGVVNAQSHRHSCS